MTVSFIYESAKDCLRWRDLSVRDHVNTVMRIGSLVHLSNENFEEILNDNEFLEVSKEDLAKKYEE